MKTIETALTYAQRALPEIYALWCAQEALDHRRTMRQVSDGTFGIGVEAYRGTFTTIRATKQISELPSYKAFESAIHAEVPLLGVRNSSPGNCVGLLIFWCRHLERHINPLEANSLQDAIDDLITKVGKFLQTSEATCRLATLVSGIRLANSVTSVELLPMLVLRNLTTQEKFELAVNDVFSTQNHDPFLDQVSSCVETTGPIKFDRNTLEVDTSDLISLQNKHEANVTLSIRAIHTVKPGRTAAYLTQRVAEPDFIPFAGVNSTSWPAARWPGSPVDFSEQELHELVRRIGPLNLPNRDSLRIAADRLVDSENRLRDADALIDAAIGLEALLTPADRDETAFRVALNFAYLPSSENARDRFEKIKNVQSLRNKIVHGGFDISILGRAAELNLNVLNARNCLREAISTFLTSPDFSGKTKLDSSFWLGRFMPRNPSI